MSELHIDPIVANRFISSLSKSLQALCHGCMEFDSGIEIGGHLYIKIDYESKVDYVLDEKVEKSQDNSMKFVSNSFLAKKDKPKQTLDGSCSPIHELQQPASLNSLQRTNYQHMSSHLQRPNHPYANTEYGALRRSSSMMKSINRKRSCPPSYTSVSNPLNTSTPVYTKFQNESFLQNQNQTILNSSYPSTSLNKTAQDSSVLQASSCTTATGFDSSVNVKQEWLGNDFAETSNTDSNVDLVEKKFSIKNEPNAAFNTENERTDIEGQTVLSDTNSRDKQKAQDNSLHGQFLNQTSSNDGEQSNSNVDNTTDNNLAGPSVPADLDILASNSQGPSGENLNFGEDFDVIEIDDEDGDVEGMFDGSHEQKGSFLGQINGSQYAKRSSANISNFSSRYLYCQVCNIHFTNNESYYRKHMDELHGREMPHACSVCDKRYRSRTGLYKHLQYHKGNFYQCPVCERSITYT